MKVRTASRSTGAVVISDSSRTPVSASCRVRGIGVADSVSTWTSAFSSFSRSLCLTPKCCSSSMISRPSRSNLMRFGKQRMRADDDIDGAVGKALARLGELLGRHQPRGVADVDRQAAEALGEGLEVLARQQRRRHHHRDLAAVHRRDESRAQRDFGLAEADIAADQPVHRRAGGKIVEHRVDRRELVLGLVIGKAGDELVVEALGRQQALRRLHGALGCDADQLPGHFEDALLHARLARLPGRAAQLVELHLGIGGAVARQQLDVLDRQEKLVVAGIAQFEAIMRRAGRRDRLQPDEARRCRARRARRCRLPKGPKPRR